MEVDGSAPGSTSRRCAMGAVVLFAAVSLDGYVGRDDDMPGPLFDWYGNGDVEMTFSDPDRPFRVTRATAEFMGDLAGRVGVMVCGRRLFDITDGWAGVPPNGEHVVVVTHRPADDWPHLGTAPFTFVPDVRAGIERARDLAGDRDGPGGPGGPGGGGPRGGAGAARGARGAAAGRRGGPAWSTGWCWRWSRWCWARAGPTSARAARRRSRSRTRRRGRGAGGRRGSR